MYPIVFPLYSHPIPIQHELVFKGISPNSQHCDMVASPGRWFTPMVTHRPRGLPADRIAQEPLRTNGFQTNLNKRGENALTKWAWHSGLERELYGQLGFIWGLHKA